jgi:aminomethyltransferase
VTNVALDAARAQALRRHQLCEEIRQLIVSRLELPVPANWITDDQPLFGRGLELDSLDALELSLGIDAEYGIPTYDDSAPLFGSVASFVEHLISLQDAGSGEGAAAVPTPPTGDTVGEYTALRSAAARFDLTDVGVLEVTGPGTLDLLQAALARDVEFVTPEQSLMSLILGAGGEVIDLVTAYLIDDGFWLETSAGRCGATARHLASLQAMGHGADAVVRDRRSDLQCVLIEGPAAPGIVEASIEPELGGIRYGAVLPLSWRGRPVVVSRTGFTGEFGYKIFAGPADLDAVRSVLADVPAAGTGTLETAMLEVRQPVLDRETATGLTALQAGYHWLIDITKDDFCGRAAIVEEFEAGLSSRLIGFTMPGGEVPIPSAELTIGGERVGHVVVATPSPGRGEVLGLALVDIQVAAAAIEMRLDAFTLTTLAAPYVYPASWSSRESGTVRD